MTVCFMIIVNTPGDSSHTFSPLLHAHWHGFTPTDLVFPSFLFAVGNALAFVMPKWEGMEQSKVLFKILKRTFIIFLLGFLMYWFPFFRIEDGHIVAAPLANTRIMGVLQRIGLCYGIGALLVYYFRTRTALIISFCLIILYWMLLYFFGDGDPYSLAGNAGLIFDRWLFGDAHLYHGEGVPFDPEGVLSTLPAVANVVAGFAAGKFLRTKGNSYEAISGLLIAGFVFVSAAWFWNLLWPINKKLWTGPFVFQTVGLDCSIIAVLVYLISIRQHTRWTGFFEVFGRNPLFIYLLSEVLVILMWMIPIGSASTFEVVYNSVFSHAGPYWGSLLFALSYMLLCWSVGYWLDKRKIYIRV